MNALHEIDLAYFGARLREARERKFWTQAQLAKRGRFHAAHISHFETGERTPSLINLIRLCRVLDVKPNELLQDFLEP